MSRQPKRTTSTGIPRVLPSRSTRFAVSATHDEALGRGDDDLLAQERAAAALEQAELRVDLVGTVDRRARAAA